MFFKRSISAGEGWKDETAVVDLPQFDGIQEVFSNNALEKVPPDLFSLSASKMFKSLQNLISILSLERCGFTLRVTLLLLSL